MVWRAREMLDQIRLPIRWRWRAGRRSVTLGPGICGSGLYVVCPRLKKKMFRAILPLMLANALFAVDCLLASPHQVGTQFEAENGRTK